MGISLWGDIVVFQIAKAFETLQYHPIMIKNATIHYLTVT